nr:epoxyqueuosine reductase QueH [Treponemataceae bacterium]
ALAPAFDRGNDPSIGLLTVFYYNPNIDEEREYRLRAAEQQELLSKMEEAEGVSFIEGEYRPEDFLDHAKHLAHEPEGGSRCTFCYALRLEKTAEKARELGFEFFTTTLSISPMKDAQRINLIGSSLQETWGVRWLWSDFKKKDGFRRSVEISKKFGLYRQDWCGCSWSKAEALGRIKNTASGSAPDGNAANPREEELPERK